MLKRVKRKSENSRDWRCFVNRVRYITNQGHPHHKLKKVVQAARNFGCLWGQTAKDFIDATHEALAIWKIRKDNRKGGGNPTKDIFFEIIYTSPKWVRTTAKERETIDQMITAPFRNCPIRRNWHLAAWELEEAERPKKWKPLDDVHYLISARDHFGNATISSRFGDGRETLESWMRRMDEEICNMLNRSREVQYEPVHLIHRRRLGVKLGVKLTQLHDMIAYHTSEPVTRENLVGVIEEMQQPSGEDPDKMEQVAKVANVGRGLEDDKLLWLLFHGREKPRKYRIEKLLLNIAETQLDIEQDRPDGNDDHEGGAGGESGGGTGGLVGVASAQPKPKPAAPGPVPGVAVSIPVKQPQPKGLDTPGMS